MLLILSIPFFVVAFLAWNRVRVFLAAANHPDFRPLFPQDPIYVFARWLDVHNVTELQFVFYTLVAGLFLAALGFLYDALLKGGGFGALGNAVLLLAGILLAAWGWSVWAPLAYQDSVPAMVLVAALGGGLVLLLAAELRHLVAGKLDDLSSGATGPAFPKKPRPRTAEDVIGRRAGKASGAHPARREWR